MACLGWPGLTSPSAVISNVSEFMCKAGLKCFNTDVFTTLEFCY